MTIDASSSEPKPSRRRNHLEVVDTCSQGIVSTGNLRLERANGSQLAKFGSERELLLRAARSVLQRGEWWGFKVDSVLRQARLSTRSFYRHFDSKNDLLLALMELELGSGIAHINRAIEAAHTPSAQIRAFVVAGIDMAYRERFVKPSCLFALNWRGIMRDYPAAVSEWTERMIAPLRAAIQRGIYDGSVTSSDAAADAFAIFHLVYSVTADQAAQGGSTPREHLERIVLLFVSRALHCDLDLGQTAEVPYASP